MMFDFDAMSVGDSPHTDYSEAIDGNNEVLSSTQQKLRCVLNNLKSQFLQYFDQLPNFSLNSGFYDLKLILTYILESLQCFFTLNSIKRIGRVSRFLQLLTPNLRFVDFSHFVGAGTSVNKFLKMYGSEVNKFLSLRSAEIF